MKKTHARKSDGGGIATTQRYKSRKVELEVNGPADPELRGFKQLPNEGKNTGRVESKGLATTWEPGGEKKRGST